MEKVTQKINVGSDKLLVFGGVYSNLQALEAVQEYALSNGYSKEEIICTGDVVAYCAQPEESVQLIRDWGIPCIAGNVEIQLRTGADDCGCNFEGDSRCDIFSRQWYPFAKKHLSEASLKWMETLPDFLEFTFKGQKVGVVHGTFDETAGYIFNSSPWEEKEKQMSKMKADLVLAGHCGLPFSNVKNDKAWLNSGAIGMPANDGTDRVWFMTLLSTEKQIVVTHHAIEYDTHEPSARMREERLPQEYARTLLTGIWDSNDILPKEEIELQGKMIQFDRPILIQKSFVSVNN
jgi:predicted phosphodiesterase